jgi:hypothetical protein
MDDRKYFETDYHDGDCDCRSCVRARVEEEGDPEADQADRYYHIQKEGGK